MRRPHRLAVLVVALGLSAAMPPAAAHAGAGIPAPRLDWTGAPGCPDGTTRADSRDRDAPVRLLRDVRAGLHPCFERVVFEFVDDGRSRHDALAFEVAYAEARVVQDGSGRPVEVEGEEVLLVRMRARTRDLSQPGAPRTYHGPERIQPAETVRIRELRRVSQFEGVLTWGLGLDARRPFRVAVLDSPVRLVIDVV